jgi:hypothetical protein
MKKKLILSILILSFVALIFSGCGGGNPVTPPPPDSEPLETIIPDTTKVVEEETIQEIASITEDQSTIVFDKSTTQLEELQEDDILFIGVTNYTPYGLLRRVTQIDRGARANAPVTLSTEFVTLEEAAEELHISEDIVFTPKDIDYERLNLPKGVTMLPSRAGFEYGHTWDLDSASSMVEGVTVDGELSINYEMIFNLDISLFHADYVEFRNIVESYTDIEVTVGDNQSFSKSTTLFTIPFTPIPVAPLVVIAPILRVNLGIDGEVEAEVTTGVIIDQTGNNRLETGFEYTNGQLHEIDNNPFFAFDAESPQLTLSGNVKPYTGPELEIILDCFPIAYSDLYGYLELTADIHEDPWWSLYGGFEGIVGAQLKILSWTLMEPREWTVYDDKKLLFDADGPWSLLNHAPVISDLTANPPNIETNQTSTITCNASDEDGDTLTYTWNKTGGTFEGSTSESSVIWEAPSTADTYTVTCEVSDGNGGEATKSVDISVSNITPTNQAPYIPNNPTPTDNSIGVLINTDLGWTGGDPDPKDTVTYDVYFEANDSSPDVLVSNDQSNTTYNPGNLNYDTHYYWKIIAKDNHGKEVSGSIWDFTTEFQVNNSPNVPNTPSGPSNGVTDTSYSFSTSTTDPNGDNIAYKFDWGDGNISNWTSYLSSGNIVNQLHSYSTKGTYYLKVKAKDVNGAESLWSNSHKIIIDLEITKPDAPSKLSATTLSQNNIALVWQDNADNETGFKIERKTGTTGTFMQIATIGDTAGSGSGVYYEDFGLTPGTTYCYKVRAYNSADNSLYSNENCTTTDPNTPLPIATTGSATNVTFNSVTLNGTVNSNGVETGALFQWGTTTSYGNLTDSQFLGSGTSNVNISANLTGLSSNTTYHFRIVATNSAAGTTYGEDRVFTTPSSPSLAFTSLTPGTVSTSQSTYVETFSAVGKNFNNVDRITVSWSGPDSGSQTWYKGDSKWNAAVNVNSDTSMTLLIKVLYNETGTQNKTWSWTVTLRDNTGKTESKSFTVTYTP